jgi:hypothetical protein
MEKDDLDLTKVDPADLPRLLAEMNATMAQHTQYLEKHFASIQSLGKAIKELESTIKKLAKTEEISLQLRQELVTFVEQHINPLYYEIEMYTALPSHQNVKHHRLSAGKPPKSNN